MKSTPSSRRIVAPPADWLASEPSRAAMSRRGPRTATRMGRQTRRANSAIAQDFARDQRDERCRKVEAQPDLQTVPFPAGRTKPRTGPALTSCGWRGNTIPETGRGNMKHYFQRFAAWFDSRDNEEGQTLVEYALIIALVSVVLIGALQLMTGALNGIFTFITSTLN